MSRINTVGTANNVVQPDKENMHGRIIGEGKEGRYMWTEVIFNTITNTWDNIPSNLPHMCSEQLNSVNNTEEEKEWILRPAIEISSAKRNVPVGTVVKLWIGKIYEDKFTPKSFPPEKRFNVCYYFSWDNEYQACFMPLQDVIPRGCSGINGNEVYFYKMSGLNLENNKYETFYPPVLKDQRTELDYPELYHGPILSYGIIRTGLYGFTNYGRAHFKDNYSCKGPSCPYTGANVIDYVAADKFAQVITTGDMLPGIESKSLLLHGGVVVPCKEDLSKNWYIKVTNNTTQTIPSGTSGLNVSWSEYLYRWTPHFMSSGIPSSGGGGFSGCIINSPLPSYDYILTTVPSGYQTIEVGPGLTGGSYVAAKNVMGIGLNLEVDWTGVPVYHARRGLQFSNQFIVDDNEYSAGHGNIRVSFAATSGDGTQEFDVITNIAGSDVLIAGTTIFSMYSYSTRKLHFTAEGLFLSADAAVAHLV